MKKLTKLFALLLIIPLLSLCFVACKDKDDSKNNESSVQEKWINVYSIQYDNHSYTSYAYLKWETVEINKEEYNSITNTLNGVDISHIDLTTLDMSISLSNIRNKLNNYIGKIYNKHYYEKYSKNVITNYEICFVSIQIITETHIKLKFGKSTFEIMSNNITIQYFND